MADGLLFFCDFSIAQAKWNERNPIARSVAVAL